MDVTIIHLKTIYLVERYFSLMIDNREQCLNQEVIVKHEFGPFVFLLFTLPLHQLPNIQ